MLSENAQFYTERAFIACFSSWLIAQFLKVVGGLKEGRRFNFRWLFDTGGMPSAHSATVTCLAVTVGFYYGFNTMPFLFVGIFSIIIMFDAAGVRRNVGKQAEILNKIVDEFSEKGEVGEERVKELLGHTPVEVFAGAFLGIVMAVLLCGLF